MFGPGLLCMRAPFLFLLACACSVFLNAGRSFENSPQRVLIVLVLHCYGNGNESKAGQLQWMIEGPELRIWLSPCLVPPPAPAVDLGCLTALGRRPVHVNGRICFGSATSTCMGDHESLDAGGALVEVKLKWMWLG